MVPISYMEVEVMTFRIPFRPSGTVWTAFTRRSASNLGLGFI